MSDTSTRQQRSADSQKAGRGRHRGPVSAQDGGTAPRGRHRKPVKPVEETVEATV